jgi:hypothetical protein
MHQGGEIVDVDAGFVRATMSEDFLHRAQSRPFPWLQTIGSDDSGDSAHRIPSPGSSLTRRDGMAALVRG